MGSVSLKEFKPTIFFLAKFVGLYVVLNLLYGFYITSYHPSPDPVTKLASSNSAFVLRVLGTDVAIVDSARKPTTSLVCDGKSIVSVYEGCNGVNVVIVFLAFIIAFGPFTKRMMWFIPLGILGIHLINLGRITLLFWVSSSMPKYMYFTHKYLFTAIIYVAVLILWVWWVRISSAEKTQS
jgi:exosortase family protein XrtF